MRRPRSDECHHCGAPLPTPPVGARTLTCEYCKTEVEVPPERPRPFVSIPGLPAQQGFVGWHVALGAAVLVLGAVVAVNAAIAPPRARPAPPRVDPLVSEVPPAAPEPPKERLRALGGLLLLELDHSDAFLALVEPWGNANSQRSLIALEPSTGRALWRHPVELDGSATALRVQLGGILVVAQPNQLSGLDPENGQTSWQRASTPSPLRACVHARDFGLIDAQGGLNGYSSTTGAPASVSRATCLPVYGSDSDAPNFVFVDARTAARWLPSGSRFEVERGLLPRHGTAQVVLGAEAGKDANRGAASVGVVTGRRFLWQANVANESPTLAHFTTPPLAAVRLERVVVPYLWNERVALSAFELATGERRWTTSLPEAGATAAAKPSGAEPPESEVAVSRNGHVAYRSPLGELFALNLETGVIEWQLGDSE